MHNLILAILCSVAVSVLLKVARKKNIIIEQAIAFNYIVAISLSYFLLKPDFKGLEFTEYLAQSDSTPIFLALGILLPTVFIIMSKAVELLASCVQMPHNAYRYFYRLLPLLLSSMKP